MTYPPPGGNPPPPGYGQQPQQPGYPPQQGGYAPQQPGYGQQQPGYPPPQQPGGSYGAPPPPMPPAPSGGKGGGALAKILGAVGTVVVLGVVIVVRVLLNDGGSSDDDDSTTLSNDEVEAAEQAESGDCMPQEPGVATDADFIVDCSDPAAFWTITTVDNEASVMISGGDVMDIADAQAVCGENVATRIPGQPWTDYNFVYDQTTSVTDQFFCLEAIQEPNESDQLPKTPDVGDCFDDATDWWTVDCGSPNALYEVVDSIPFDPPVEMTETDAEAESANCSGGEWYAQVTDPYQGLTGGIVCYNVL